MKAPHRICWLAETRVKRFDSVSEAVLVASSDEKVYINMEYSGLIGMFPNNNQ